MSIKNSKILALEKLGVLCLGENIKDDRECGTDSGPHLFSEHNPLCVFENPLYQYPFQDSRLPTFEAVPPYTTVQTVFDSTRLVVMLGATDSQEMRHVLSRQDSLVLIFEPDERRLATFLETTPLPRLTRNGVFCFTGDPYSYDPPLQDMLPRAMFQTGCPAFFMTQRIREHSPVWAEQIIEYLEILHYRHYLYLLGGQRLKRSRPIRDIHRDITYDQQVHGYENICDLLSRPDVLSLKGTLKGQTAIVVAAGPDLNSRIEYIRRNRDRAVVISVNNAVKPLLEAGVEPHFTVINDMSIFSGRVFKHIPVAPDTILVGHCLADLGGDKFHHKYLFGEFLPEVFGELGDLRLHGSVITTAFSLAELLGCVRCIFVGGQLASRDPWELSYAKGTVNEYKGLPQPKLTHRHPQHYPVTTPFGEQFYTTLNFRDAALWLSETIRVSGIECINTSKASILYGKGICFEAEPELPDGDISGHMKSLHEPQSTRGDYAKISSYIQTEKTRWKNLLAWADEVEPESGEVFIAKGMAVLELLDKENVTYLIEHSTGFDNKVFHRHVFEGGPVAQEKGLRMYFSSLREMAMLFLGELERQERLCAELIDQRA